MCVGRKGKEVCVCVCVRALNEKHYLRSSTLIQLANYSLPFGMQAVVCFSSSLWCLLGLARMLTRLIGLKTYDEILC